jgi:endo-1,4-beta-xylanase
MASAGRVPFRPAIVAVAAALTLGVAGLSGLATNAMADPVEDDATTTQAVISSVDFEDGSTGDWTQSGGPTLTVMASPVSGNDTSVLSITRAADYEGIQSPAGVFNPGSTYTFTMSVRLGADTSGTRDIRFVAKPDYTWIGNATVSSETWTTVTGEWTVPDSTDVATTQVYIGSAQSDDESAYTFYVDDIVVTSKDDGETPVIQDDLEAIKDTVPFPVGVAIDSRETSGVAAELLLKHFNQVTPENSMKPESWYDATTREFRTDPQTVALMDFAQANGVHVYGHNLVWHSQTPAWFFQNEAGDSLTDSAADQAVLKQRLHDHIFAVAKAMSDQWGLFGSPDNPLVSFDVVNEVIDDGSSFADGLRRSPWHAILGEQYIDLAFQWADEAFNHEYADPSADRPITLFINDYNTEQPAKAGRLHDLVSRLLDRGAPVDGVGHQFHVNLAIPPTTFDQALTTFQDLPVVQAVTELDVTTGVPVTTAKLVEQGYYYRDAFQIFRDHTDDLFCVTLWGLTDSRSWRIDSGDPLAFDDDYQAKAAYWGIVDGEMPALVQSANVFQANLPTTSQTVTSIEWSKLPTHAIGTVGSFQARWSDDGLSVWVSLDDATAGADDTVTFTLDGQVFTVHRDGSGDVPAAVVSTETGYDLVAKLPLTNPAEGVTAQFDLQVQGAADAAVGWNLGGGMGTLTLVEPVSYVEVPETSITPVIDGVADDDAWSQAVTVSTDKQIVGDGGATAAAHLTWQADTLYIVMDVTDPTIDLTGSDPWTQDSVEIYVDRGNHKNGAYLDSDTQIRISADNHVSFGTGDADIQASLVQSATTTTDHGYIVEVAVDLQDFGGQAAFEGLDVQVNDATDGARTAIHNWADPTNAGYQSTGHWGVAQLVAAETPPAPEPTPTPTAEPTETGTPTAPASPTAPGSATSAPGSATSAPGAQAATGGGVLGSSLPGLAVLVSLMALCGGVGLARATHRI